MNLKPEAITRINSLLDRVSNLDPAPLIRGIVRSYPGNLTASVTTAVNGILDNFTQAFSGYISDTVSGIPEDPEALDAPHAVHELATVATSEVLKDHPEAEEHAIYADMCIVAAIIVKSHTKALSNYLQVAL